MKAIILAAGLGLRLKPLTDTVPKVMLPIKGKPLLEYLIDNLKEYGIKDIGMNLFYLPDVITDYFGSGEMKGVKLVYKKEKTMLGTSGTLNQFIDWIGKDDFLIVYGDNFFHLDYDSLIKESQKNKNSLATICVQHLENLEGKGLVSLGKNNRIVSFIEKPEHPEKFHTDLVNAGIYYLKNEVLNFIPKNVFSDFSKDIFPALLKDNKILSAYIIKEPLIDIGTLKSYNSVK